MKNVWKHLRTKSDDEWKRGRCAVMEIGENCSIIEENDPKLQQSPNLKLPPDCVLMLGIFWKQFQVRRLSCWSLWPFSSIFEEFSPISITTHLPRFHSSSDLVLRCFQTFFMNTPIQSVHVRPRENQTNFGHFRERRRDCSCYSQLSESAHRRCRPSYTQNAKFFVVYKRDCAR